MKGKRILTGKKPSPGVRRLKMAARTVRTEDIRNFQDFEAAVNNNRLSYPDKDALRYDIGGFITEKLHNRELRYIVMDFCAGLYNSVTTKLRSKILNVIFEQKLIFRYNELFAGGTFLTEKERDDFISNTTPDVVNTVNGPVEVFTPFKRQSDYDILIDHLIGMYTKGGTNANYHMARYNRENKFPKTFEEERKEIGPLTDYDFILVINPYLEANTRYFVVEAANAFFNDVAGMERIIEDVLNYHPIRREMLSFTVPELTKEVFLLSGEKEPATNNIPIELKNDLVQAKVIYTARSSLRRVFLEPFNVPEPKTRLMPYKANPIAELFDFDCFFGIGDQTPFGQNEDKFRCKNTEEEIKLFWRWWTEIRRYPENSYAEIILNERPATEFINFYLQTIDITIFDIEDTLRRTEGKKDAKWRKRTLRRDTLKKIRAFNKGKTLGYVPSPEDVISSERGCATSFASSQANLPEPVPIYYGLFPVENSTMVNFEKWLRGTIPVDFNIFNLDPLRNMHVTLVYLGGKPPTNEDTKNKTELLKLNIGKEVNVYIPEIVFSDEVIAAVVKFFDDAGNEITLPSTNIYSHITIGIRGKVYNKPTKPSDSNNLLYAWYNTNEADKASGPVNAGAFHNIRSLQFSGRNSFRMQLKAVFGDNKPQLQPQPQLQPSIQTFNWEGWVRDTIITFATNVNNRTLRTLNRIPLDGSFNFYWFGSRTELPNSEAIYSFFESMVDKGYQLTSYDNVTFNISNAEIVYIKFNGFISQGPASGNYTMNLTLKLVGGNWLLIFGMMEVY